MSDEREVAEVVTELETLSLELMQRLDRRVEEAKGDPVAADELFVIAGLAEAALRAASEHVSGLRETLERAVRESR